MKIKIDHKTIDLNSVDWVSWKTENKNLGWKIAIIDFLERFSNSFSTTDLQTSGSTGKPKIISAKKEHLLNSAKATCEFFNLNESSTGLLCMNAKYIGAQMMLVRAIVSGMNLLTTEPKANPVEDLNESIDFAAMVPYQVKNSLKTIQKFNLIKNLIIGGGKTGFELEKKLKVSSVKCYETFGMTETYSHIALKQVSPISQDNFKCLLGISIESSKNNQLIINAPNIGINKLITHDIIELKNNNSFKWIGRIDNIINSGGIKISPEEIENKIAHLFTQNFCIIGLPHKELGEQVTLVIEGNQFNPMELNSELNMILPKYHLPKGIKIINSFPRTENGKVKRKELQKLLLT
ncbi:MAG: AMP-binding protein [Salinivirgaceae bacterium]|nr:AMP-binding protein [Salinivirgaceae bacterium]